MEGGGKEERQRWREEEGRKGREGGEKRVRV